MASTLPGYAYSYFLPIILREGMGFSQANSQLLTAPPYGLAAIIAFVSGWLGDRYQVRGPIICVHQLLTAVGMLVTAYGKTNAARYFGAFLGESSKVRQCKRYLLTVSPKELDSCNSVCRVS